MTRIHHLSMAGILLFSAPQAHAEFTFGLDLFKDSGDRELSAGYYSSSSENVIDSSAADSTGFRLRLGFGSIKDSRGEIYFSKYEADDAGPLGYSNEWELGGNYIFTFMKNPTNPLLKPVSPFLKAGLGFGGADTEVTFIYDSGDTTDNLYNVHLNLGGGVSYSFTDNIAITGSIEYVYRNWQDFESGVYTFSTSDSLFRFGIGVGVTF